MIGGDGLVASIAAASIVAKVTRDRLMARLGAAHPGYGFERHMGYSVPEHFAALDRLGPTIHHRRSFAPVAGSLADLVGRGRRRFRGRIAPVGLTRSVLALHRVGKELAAPSHAPGERGWELFN